MRQIVFDTETTGFKPEEGHRVVEIGAVELMRGAVTGRTFHVYVNPQREMPDEAFKVHGLSTEFLSDKPVFAHDTIGPAFLEFVEGAELIAHNAQFDMRFMQWELENAGLGRLGNDITDTLQIARRKFPGSPASLDALCSRFGVDTAERERYGHGALLDSRLLAEVYIELTGGAQAGLDFATMGRTEEETASARITLQRPTALSLYSNAPEEAAHAEFISEMDQPLWEKYT
ncbi:DNA polymerase III subunit epsilon [Parvularcula sp. IMCC14364]|uniref:DNA polymerase III subunit epsilon n=1 Tax=Parvularcula sp. IMCC14364 TaxID=3067902 RepID=UPI0027424A2D|nr:DNA polymerase III subunit epsilon [Parvularcula sp. IMCC14364]